MAELAGYQDINSVIGLTLTEQMRNMKAKVVGVIENVKLAPHGNKYYLCHST